MRSQRVISTNSGFTKNYEIIFTPSGLRVWLKPRRKPILLSWPTDSFFFTTSKIVIGVNFGRIPNLMDGNRHNTYIGTNIRQISSFAPTCVEMQKIFPVANLAKPVRSTQIYVLAENITYGHEGCGRRNSWFFWLIRCSF